MYSSTSTFDPVCVETSDVCVEHDLVANRRSSDDSLGYPRRIVPPPAPAPIVYRAFVSGRRVGTSIKCSSQMQTHVKPPPALIGVQQNIPSFRRAFIFGHFLAALITAILAAFPVPFFTWNDAA